MLRKASIRAMARLSSHRHLATRPLSTRNLSSGRNRRLAHDVTCQKDVKSENSQELLTLPKLLELHSAKQLHHFVRAVDSYESYPICTSSRDELETVIRGHLQLMKSTPANKLPTARNNAIILSCPYKGSELLLESLTESIATKNGVEFLSISNRDVFIRLSGEDVISAMPVQTDNIKGKMAIKTVKKAPPLIMGLNMIELKMESESGSREDEAKEDCANVPYPWFTGFTRNGEEKVLLKSRLQKDNATSKSLIPLMIREQLSSFLSKTLKNSQNPLIIYYSDFLKILLSSDEIIEKEILAVLQDTLDEYKEQRDIVLLMPSTKTFKSPSKQSSGQNMIQALMQQVNKPSVGSAPKTQSTTPSSHPPNFQTILDPYFGYTVVNIYPPSDRQGLRTFNERIEKDFQQMCMEHNYHELLLTFSNTLLADKITYLQFESIILGLRKEFGVKSTIFEQTFMCVEEIEHVTLLTLGKFSELTVEESFKEGCSLYAKGRMMKSIISAGGEYAHAFKNDPSLIKSLTQHEEQIMKQCLLSCQKVDSFTNVGGLAKTKQTIEELISLPLQRPELFSKGVLRKSTSGILLFGPPGTGKTLLARAVASESGANFLNVQMSSISSMWVGEAEKNVKALFSLARKLSPCVIFVDEIDALLRARQSTQATHVVNTINEFMQEWDGVMSENQGVIVVGATNRPFDLDEAVLRRLPRRIMVNMPGVIERKDILEILLKEEVIGSGIDEEKAELIDSVAKKTDMYSGSDLKNLCIAAAMHGLRECIADGKNQGEDRKMELRHFLKAFESGDVVPSLTDKAELMKQLKDWDRSYGTGATGYGKGLQSLWGF